MSETGHTAPTVTVHRPDKPGSTMVVTAKAYASVYAAEGYVMGAEGHAVVDQQGVATLQQQNAALLAELAALRPAGQQPATATPPATSSAPAPRAPRKRAPRKAAAAPAAPAPSTEPAPGPADIGSTSPLDG